MINAKSSIGACVAIGIALVGRNLYERGRIPPTWDLALGGALAGFEFVNKIRKSIPREIRRASIDVSFISSDLIFAIPIKSGSTVTSHMGHLIRTQAAPLDFEDQNDVIPWIEIGAKMLKTDLNSEQVASPRLFKSHMVWSDPNLPTDGEAKLVYCFRDFMDVIVSTYHFLSSMLNLDNKIVTPEGLFSFVLMNGEIESQFKNLVDFWEHRNEPHVMFLFYDDILQDRENVAKRMIEFMTDTTDSSDIFLEAVVAQSNHSVMSSPENHWRFNEEKLATIFAANRGEDALIDPSQLIGKARRGGGRSGEGKDIFCDSLWAAYNRTWNAIVTTATGFPDLDSMRAAHKAELERE